MEVRQDKYVQISMEYLPDFSEEYSINVHSGLGTNDTEVTLANGWNLTAINQKLDSQFDENVGALANLLKSAAPGGIVGTAGDQVRGPSMVVQSTNVPLGYYDSVISRGADGKKRLYGWRYVGFYPINACPMGANGGDCVDCHSSLIYGLVFREGVMTFEAMYDIAQRGASEVVQIPAREVSRLPLTIQILDSMARKAKEAVKTQLGIAENSFEMGVEESRPHMFFTVITRDSDNVSTLVTDNKEDLVETLNGIIQEATGQPYSAVVRVLKPVPRAAAARHVEYR